MSKRRIGPKAVTWDWAQLAVFTDETHLYRLSERQAASLRTVTAAQMAWSTRWFNAPSVDSIARFQADVTLALMTPVELPPVPPAQAQGWPVCIECEESEDDMRPVFQVFGGQLYIGVDCGCGRIDWYPVGPSQPLGPDGAPLAPDAGGGGGGLFPSTAPPATCYAEKATGYLLARAQQYVEFATSLTALALDTAFGPFDETVDVIAVIKDIADGDADVTTIRSLTASTVNAAIGNPATVSALESGWNFTGEVSRPDLLSWVNQHAPNIVDGVPVRAILLYWLSNSIIPGYNRDLSKLANECASGQTFLPPVNPVAPVSIEIGESGTYRYYEVVDLISIELQDADYTIALPHVPDDIAIAGSNNDSACSTANSNITVSTPGAGWSVPATLAGNATNEFNRLWTQTDAPPTWEAVIGTIDAQVKGTLGGGGGGTQSGSTYAFSSAVPQGSCYPFVIKMWYRVAK